MRDLSEIHRTKGKICSYVLKCEGDENFPFYVYCGYTAKDLEKRMLQHSGQISGGALFTKEHKPTGEILALCVHETEEEAMASECAFWNLWAGKLGNYDQIRGGRYNGVAPLKYAPRCWDSEK